MKRREEVDFFLLPFALFEIIKPFMLLVFSKFNVYFSFQEEKIESKRKKKEIVHLKISSQSGTECEER